MLLSELIGFLQAYKNQQGDCPVLFDVPERDYYDTLVSVEGKWYTGNTLTELGQRENQVFIILEPNMGPS
jgi:hypothetical protein